MNPDMVARIEKLMKEDQLSNWEHNFLESLTMWVNKGRGISHRQNTTLQNIEAKYSDDKKAALEAWKEGYTPEMRENMTIMAHYYINNPPYFASLARAILKEEGFIPTEKQYRGMCENKYAQKVLALARQTPRFEVGQMVAFRSIPSNGHREGKLAIVLEHLPEVYSAAKDAKRLRVLLIGETEPTETEERWLKKAKV